MRRKCLSLLLILALCCGGCASTVGNNDVPQIPEIADGQEEPEAEVEDEVEEEEPLSGGIDVRITKIYYDGQVYRTEADEYVEIKNLGGESVDLVSWRIVDIDEGYPSLTFPSYVLEPGEIIRVYTNEYHPEHGGFSFGFGKAVWNNSDPDTAVLYDSQGYEVSRKSY